MLLNYQVVCCFCNIASVKDVNRKKCYTCKACGRFVYYISSEVGVADNACVGFAFI